MILENNNRDKPEYNIYFTYPILTATSMVLLTLRSINRSGYPSRFKSPFKF